MTTTAFQLRQLGYDLETGLFARPAVWIVLLATLALVVPQAEVRLVPELSAWLATEPGAAQVVLGTVAGSMMTVISVVYSILLVALSLASIQFSTRILSSLTRDGVAQHTLGLFVGTFVYCLLLLRSVRSDPPFVPGVALTGALALAITALAGLVWFIHHVVRGIQANHLVDRIAAETELVVDDVFRERLEPGSAMPSFPVPDPPADADPVRAATSGYVQIIDEDALQALAARTGKRIHLVRAMGHFVAEGLPLALVIPAATAQEAAAVIAAVDIGPVRTMQRDVEFGVRQIVDIALKAISPAVNDPSTAATCIDHLGRLLVRVAGRRPVPVERGGFVLAQTTLADLVDLAFEQLRQYGRTDMAVALRLMRVLGEVASVTRDTATLARVETHARLLDASARAAFAADDCDELTRRRAAVARVCAPG